MDTKETVKLIAIATIPVSILIGSFTIASTIQEINFYPTENPSRTLVLDNKLSDIASKIDALSPHTNEVPRSNGEITSLLSNPDSMYLKDAAKYLDITSQDLEKIIVDPDSKIPYLKTSTGLYIFNKKTLNNWLNTSYIIK